MDTSWHLRNQQWKLNEQCQIILMWMKFTGGEEACKYRSEYGCSSLDEHAALKKMRRECCEVTTGVNLQGFVSDTGWNLFFGFFRLIFLSYCINVTPRAKSSHTSI